MSFGFGTAYGRATTDKVESALTTDPAQRSWHMWSYRNGHGGSNLGRLFDQATNVISFFDNENNVSGTYAFNRGWSVVSGSWRWTAPAGGVWASIGLSYDNGATTNNPVAYVDGAKPTVTTATVPVGTANSAVGILLVGNRPDDLRCWDGMHAEFAVWDALLTDAEFLALSQGASPLTIRPALLVEYIPMVRQGRSKKLAAPTITGTVPQPHPPISIPRTMLRRGGSRTFIG
jgi:hypothetical protein